jgi:subtilisin family serine protease
MSARTQRALRVAASGYLVKTPTQFARAMTQLAALYSVGGRAITTQQSAVSRLAELLPIGSLFGKGVEASWEEVSNWLLDIKDQQPDIVLMDFGADDSDPKTEAIIKQLAESSFLIAAAGNSGAGQPLAYPARLPQVFAVGALETPDQVADYSSLPKSGDKPELHALGSLRNSPLRVALNSDLPEGQQKGTSHAALQVTAAAALVWSTYPGGDVEWLRNTLLSTATEVTVKGRKSPIRTLNIEGALEEARKKVVTDALTSTELTFAELQGAVGLPAAVLDRLLEKLEKVEKRIISREDAGSIVYRLRNGGGADPAPNAAGNAPAGARIPAANIGANPAGGSSAAANVAGNPAAGSAATNVGGNPAASAGGGSTAKARGKRAAKGGKKPRARRRSVEALEE